MGGREYVELDLEVIHMTADAVYLSDGDVEDWVPNSLIKDCRDIIGWDDVGKTLTLEVEQWKAEEVGFV